MRKSSPDRRFPRRGHPRRSCPPHREPRPRDFRPNPHTPDFPRGDESQGWAPHDHLEPARWDYEQGECADEWCLPCPQDFECFPCPPNGEDWGWEPYDDWQPHVWDYQHRRHEDEWHSNMTPDQHCLKPVMHNASLHPMEEYCHMGAPLGDQEAAWFPPSYRGRGWKPRRGRGRGSRGKFSSQYHSFPPRKEKFKSSRLSDSYSTKNLKVIQLEPIQETSKHPSQASSTTEADHPSSEATEPLDPVRPEETELVQLGAGLEAADCHSQAWSSLATEPVPMEDPHFLQGEEIKLVQLDVSCQATENSSQPAFDVLPEPSTPPETTEDLCPVKLEGMDVHLPLQLEASHLAMDHPTQVTSALATEPPALPDTTEDLHLLRMEETEMDQLGTSLEAASYQHQGSVAVFTPPLSTEDRRSAAILARKEEIELSYQQFSLTIAVVATMLLQKEPSMEAAMGSALRANLQQIRGHYLQELENFIDSYDSAATSS
ncbi:PREDICTED: uncharacterized protein LOC109295388 [Gavialis gangeticus]|uniref:uncharacterized protein LOC109295388 n=1 Tax=Gavialis gangeticus TaxID=94835 RepID=UPI00092E422B|nr:PREDICTED: uncharacterized protein LOC109295388 [Gavialis gangeticus]XP_019369781.1 PREDICTED: uncharacterized protein LOC109295388 [Gavialis gangeticus]XP_019369782.1 PREDICTED: uncharacterized protein LOC109295388 [Gavialis gangeticus]XP_019369783.1 PREDICTED: uncharacterized protein LOC109295388 [Gavialis gangeticus]XP_019369784.1 PREDICTED: uncharacterized protein LOC109295388 [Gavialis gangeticus]